MKSVSITVERNFHIMNDDRFIMEKISQVIELEKDEDAQCAMNVARADIAENFKIAYPKVYSHLNFDEVIQVDKPLMNLSKEMIDAHDNATKRNQPFIVSNGNAGSNFGTFQNGIHTPAEKINKGTIEEQIEACTTEKELESFKLIAFMNPKLKELWQLRAEQINQLIIQEMVNENS